MSTWWAVVAGYLLITAYMAVRFEQQRRRVSRDPLLWHGSTWESIGAALLWPVHILLFAGVLILAVREAAQERRERRRHG